MKRQVFALSLLAAACGGATAQSSVTMYGIIDLGPSSIKQGSAGTVRGITAGAVSTSRLGFRGVEDLGGGLKAGFNLEAGMSPDVGDINPGGRVFFDRRSTVSLMGSFGEVRIGSDYNPSTRITYLMDPYVGTSVGSVLNFTFAQGKGATNVGGAGLGSGVATQRSLLRNSNSVAYFLPSGLGGLYGEVMIAAGEGGPAGSKYRSGRLGWATGPVDVAAAYGKAETGVNDFNQWNVGATYNFGATKVMGLYNVNEYGAIKQKTWALGASVLVLGHSEIRANFARNDRSGGAAGTPYTNNSDSTLISAGYIYNLSKRTGLYAIGARVKNKGNAFLSVTYGTAAGMNGGETASGIQAGITHRF